MIGIVRVPLRQVLGPALSRTMDFNIVAQDTGQKVMGRGFQKGYRDSILTLSFKASLASLGGAAAEKAAAGACAATAHGGLEAAREAAAEPRGRPACALVEQLVRSAQAQAQAAGGAPAPVTVHVRSSEARPVAAAAGDGAAASGGGGGGAWRHSTPSTASSHSQACGQRTRILTFAHVCSRMLTYAHVCSRMLT
jgi:hypothetical protein